MRSGVGGLLLAGVVASATVVAGVVPAVGASVSEEAPSVRAPAALEDLGCFIGRSATGGLRLDAAVRRFQIANRLGQTGELNRRTRTRLASPKAARCDVRPVPAHSGNGRRIVMSQGQNWLWLVRADGTVAAQGGVVDNNWLPHRAYATGDQCGRPGRSRYRSTEDDALSINFFVRFAYCKVGFHEIPVSRRTGQKIHPDYLVGTNLTQSHGCVRMAHPLIDRLWQFTEKPTTVVVVD